MTRHPESKRIVVVALFVLALTLMGSKCTRNKTETPQTSPEYAQREQSAPPAVRQKLAEMRQRIKEQNLGFEVGYTYAMERDAASMTGADLSKYTVEGARTQNAIAQQVVELDRQTLQRALQDDPQLRAKLIELTRICVAGDNSYDWRRSGKVTPVRTQGCGNCWAYGAMAPLESSYLIRNDTTTDGSEQFIVSNSGAGTCKGGGAKGAIDFLVATGTTTDANLPDSGTDGTPNVDGFSKPYQALVSGFASDTSPGTPSVSEIKAAVCEYGPVVSWIGVTDTFMAYTGNEVYKDPDYNNELKKPCPSTGPPNGAVCGHFVTIVGWNDAKNAWLIKNSWGTSWGQTCGFGSEKGYMWIDYGSNQIGSWAMWETARNKYYQLPTRYYEILHLRVPDPGPIKPGPIDVGKP
jgi:cathepsin L